MECWGVLLARLSTDRYMSCWKSIVANCDKLEHIHSYTRTEKRSVDLYSLLGIQSVADVVRHSRLRWFGHLEHRSEDDWVSACRNEEVAGLRCRGRNRKTECVNDDMTVLGLQPEWAILWQIAILNLDFFIIFKFKIKDLKMKSCDVKYCDDVEWYVLDRQNYKQNGFRKLFSIIKRHIICLFTLLAFVGGCCNDKQKQ